MATLGSYINTGKELLGLAGIQEAKHTRHLARQQAYEKNRIELAKIGKTYDKDGNIVYLDPNDRKIKDQFAQQVMMDNQEIINLRKKDEQNTKMFNDAASQDIQDKVLDFNDGDTEAIRKLNRNPFVKNVFTQLGINTIRPFDVSSDRTGDFKNLTSYDGDMLSGLTDRMKRRLLIANTADSDKNILFSPDAILAYMGMNPNELSEEQKRKFNAGDDNYLKSKSTSIDNDLSENEPDEISDRHSPIKGNKKQSANNEQQVDNTTQQSDKTEEQVAKTEEQVANNEQQVAKTEEQVANTEEQDIPESEKQNNVNKFINALNKGINGDSNNDEDISVADNLLNSANNESEGDLDKRIADAVDIIKKGNNASKYFGNFAKSLKVASDSGEFNENFKSSVQQDVDAINQNDSISTDEKVKQINNAVDKNIAVAEKATQYDDSLTYEQKQKQLQALYNQRERSMLNYAMVTDMLENNGAYTISYYNSKYSTDATNETARRKNYLDYLYKRYKLEFDEKKVTDEEKKSLIYQQEQIYNIFKKLGLKDKDGNLIPFNNVTSDTMYAIINDPNETEERKELARAFMGYDQNIRNKFDNLSAADEKTFRTGTLIARLISKGFIIDNSLIGVFDKTTQDFIKYMNVNTSHFEGVKGLAILKNIFNDYRNSLFGSALTEHEMKAFTDAVGSEYMSLAAFTGKLSGFIETIQEKLEGLTEDATIEQRKALNKAIRTLKSFNTFNEVIDDPKFNNSNYLIKLGRDNIKFIERKGVIEGRNKGNKSSKKTNTSNKKPIRKAIINDIEKNKKNK